MPAVETDPRPRRRRHGHELETAILDAGWTELVLAGYGNLTMDSVARRAGTSEPVLYRRWPHKDELVLAVLNHYHATHPVDLPDTGTLRGDLFAALIGMSTFGAGFFAVATAAAFGGLAARMGLSPEQVRDRVMGDQRVPRMMMIYERAHQRGEIDLSRIDPVVLSLPFDLIRHDLLMNPQPVPEERIAAILDKALLPLIHR